MTNYQTIEVSVKGVLTTVTWSRKIEAMQAYRRRLMNKQQYRYLCLAKQTWNTRNGALTSTVIMEEYMDLLNGL